MCLTYLTFSRCGKEATSFANAVMLRRRMNVPMVARAAWKKEDSMAEWFDSWGQTSWLGVLGANPNIINSTEGQTIKLFGRTSQTIDSIVLLWLKT